MTREKGLEKEDDLRNKMTWERWLEEDDLTKMTWEKWLENKHWSHGQMLWETMLEQIINMDCFDAYSKDFYRCVLWMKAETGKKLNHERKSWDATWQLVQVHISQSYKTPSVCFQSTVTCLQCRSVKKWALVLCWCRRVRFSSCPHGQNKPEAEERGF